MKSLQSHQKIIRFRLNEIIFLFQICYLTTKIWWIYSIQTSNRSVIVSSTHDEMLRSTDDNLISQWAVTAYYFDHQNQNEISNIYLLIINHTGNALDKLRRVGHRTISRGKKDYKVQMVSVQRIKKWRKSGHLRSTSVARVNRWPNDEKRWA